MPITYPVPPESRWAVLRESTGEIVSRNQPWPRADGGPIEGLDPDYVYLKHVTATPPDYDSRLYSLQGTETVDVPANALRLTWATVKRPADEQVSAAENVEAEKNSALIRLEREAFETRLMLAAVLAYQVNGTLFPAKVRAAADAYIAKGTKLWKNRDRLQAIIAQIQAGQEPNLDAGWEAA